MRYNALKHGFRARTVLAPGENFEEYDVFRQGFYDQWKPANPTETAFVEQVATAFWRLERVRRIEAEMMEDDIERCTKRYKNDKVTLGFSIARDLAPHNTYNKLGLYEARIDRKSTHLNSSHTDIARMPSSA